MKQISALIGLFCILLLSVAEARPVTVFAASSMTDAVDEILDLYRQKNGSPVIASYAASSSLARQITAGAPADIYISANQRWMDYLEKQQMLVDKKSPSLAGNQLVLIGQQNNDPPVTLQDLPTKLGNERLAIADPAHVPAGLYSRQALEKLGIWSEIQPRLASAQNVRSALLLVERGEAPYGIVYQTDARLSDKVKILTRINPALHQPVIYPIARIRGSQNESEALYQFFLSPQAMNILQKHGFTQPPAGTENAQ
ncbi:MAG: molybdate ABC transporter substrate-binding protein [Amphritea sp.]|nr:molybdate ABC transporter substrate-binding protein [Amphritea sp.]